MNCFESNNKVVIEAKNFNIAQTLECGQCFRFEKIDHDTYVIIAFHKVLFAKQTGETLELYPTSIFECKTIWFAYFDLLRNYECIKEQLQKDNILHQAIAFAPGLHIMQQDPWETLISFIISQNNNIPRIKQIIKSISQKYGDLIALKLNVPYTIEYTAHCFPTVLQLNKANNNELMECKTGYRAQWIIHATEAATKGKIPLKANNDVLSWELKEKLLAIKGVGNKVADCVLLFGYGKVDCFPIDTWVRRIMQQLYFEGKKVPIDYIQDFAKEKFGQHAGLAQQYLFHYAKNIGIK